MHISELIEQHRRAADLDDASFEGIIRRFYEAQSACTMERFGEGLEIYKAIPVGRVLRSTLR